MYGADGHFDRIADPGEIGLAEQGQQGGIKGCIFGVGEQRVDGCQTAEPFR